MDKMRIILPTQIALAFALLALAPPFALGETPPVDGARIEQLTGVKGKLSEQEGVFKISAPRDDLHVSVAGVRMTPPMGLTSWAGFTRAGAQTMVMGDVVLLEDQVNPVMSLALDNGLEVTALHNHFLWDSPRIMFMHITGRGDEGALAAAVGKVFAGIRQTHGARSPEPKVHPHPGKTSLNPKTIDDLLGTHGELAHGVYKVTLGRTTTLAGHTLGNAMGVNTWAAFMGSDRDAVVDGDFAMYEDELQAVLKALRGGGINVVAIHNHMSQESPKVVFLHYWGENATHELAKTLRAALDTQKKSP